MVESQLKLQISQFQAALQEAQQSLRKFKGRAQSEGSALGTAVFGGMSRTMLAGIGGVVTAGIAGLAGAAYAGVKGLKEGLNFNTELSNAEVGITNILARFLDLDSQAAKAEAAKAIEKIVELEPKAAGGLQDLVQGFMSTAAAALSAGLTVEQNIELVGKFANALANAGISADQLAQEMRSIMSGNITSDSAIAKILQISNEDVNRAKAAGQLYDMLIQKIGKFGDAGESPSVIFSSLTSSASKLMGTLSKPVFDVMIESAKKLTSLLEGEAIQGFAEDIATKMKSTFDLMRATFQELSSGGAMQVVADGLEMAIKSAINTWWAGLFGAIRAAGQYLQEVVRNLVRVFGYMTTGEFWSGMGNALLGIARMFVASLMDGLARFLEEAKKIPGVTKIVGNANEALRSEAQWTRNLGRDNLADARERVGPLLEENVRSLQQSALRIAEAFRRGFVETDNIFDTSELAQRMSQFMERVRDRLPDTAAAEEVTTTGGKNAAPSAASDEKRHVTPGVFASAVNLLMGRGPNELILDEMKKQSQTQQEQVKQQQETNKKLERIERKLGAKAEGFFPDLTPRFS